MNLQKKLSTLLRLNPKEESGFTLVEIMVAAVIIVIILLATAYGLTNSFRQSSNIENRNKAIALVNDLIAVAKQAPYEELYIADRSAPAGLIGQDMCDPVNKTPVGTVLATGPAGGDFVDDFISCQEVRFSEIGATFYVSTQISYLTTSASFDNGGGAVTNGDYVAKRIYITIRWRDVQSGETSWNTVQGTYTKTPSPSECIPDTIPVVGSQPAGCGA